MARVWTSGQEQRKSPRVDVLMRVQGLLEALETPIIVHDLSRSGFAVISEMAFVKGQMLDFRLVAADGSTVNVTAEAVHSRPAPATPGLHMSGFKFTPGRLTGVVPQVAIDQLIATIAPSDVHSF